ncbi:MAG: class I SAM-dependent methyltransferase [Cystobacter sp.]
MSGREVSRVELLRQAHARREPLRQRPDTTAYRLVHGAADGVPDVTVDVFEALHVVSLYRELSSEEETALLEDLDAAWAPPSVYLKRRPREARHLANVAREQLAPEEAMRGASVESVVARENGCQFLIRPGQGLSVGLYLDMREPRAWLAREARGRTVLNLFSYTCAFGVVATAGGARRVLNVDASRKVLEWGEQNARLNGQPVDRYDYVAGDVFEWLERLARKGETFEVVVVDPPSFATTRTSRFSAAKDYAALAALAARVVAPGGRLVACCNLATLAPRRFEAMVTEGVARAGRRAGRGMELEPSSVDFPAPPEHPAALKVRVVELS